MAGVTGNYYTVEEYLWEEQRSEIKRDYYKGQVYAMAGGSADYSRIAINLTTELTVALRGRDCEAFNSDLKVGIASAPSLNRKGRAKKPESEDFITYPDASVVCGSLEYYKGDHYTIANPSLLFEVLSPSTRNYDRSFKLEQYQKIPSLQAYVMIDSEQVRVECYTRLGSGQWLQQTLLNLDDVLTLEALGISLPLKMLYERVVFEADEEE
ncbi:MAG TPA: Uma2 family endonuclease [Chloroflexia bacterium]|nr:Uma2 family endonuclease [Chloroflexia bacterium]